MCWPQRRSLNCASIEVGELQHDWSLSKCPRFNCRDRLANLTSHRRVIRLILAIFSGFLGLWQWVELSIELEVIGSPPWVALKLLCPLSPPGYTIQFIQPSTLPDPFMKIYLVPGDDSQSFIYLPDVIVGCPRKCPYDRHGISRQRHLLN